MSNPLNLLNRLWTGFCNRIFRGDSVWIFVVVIVVSALLLWFLTAQKTMVREWAYEPIILVPKEIQQIPFVRQWFQATRGGYYVTIQKEGESTTDALKNFTKLPKKKPPSHVLFSGWAFLHCLQHFLLAFLCPKLVYVNVIYGIGWEILEALFHSHCTLDIFWNMCGTLLGLLFRQILFPS
jgi:hypothetical protein